MLIQMLFRFLQVRNLNVELMQLVLQIAVQIRAGEMESLLIAQIKKNTWVYQKKRDLLLQQVNTAITNFWVSVLSIEKPTVFFQANLHWMFRYQVDQGSSALDLAVEKALIALVFHPAKCNKLTFQKSIFQMWCQIYKIKKLCLILDKKKQTFQSILLINQMDPRRRLTRKVDCR